MKIKIEETNGKKKYWVNDVPYDSIEAMPAEYRQYFVDKNNNGVPDQFDEDIEKIKMMPGSKFFEDVFKSFSDKKGEIETTEPRPRSSDLSYSPENAGSSMLSPIVKIVMVLLVVLVVVLLYPRYKEWSNRPTDKNVEVAGSVSQDPQPVKGRVTLVMDDPNEPPYRMLGVVYDNGVKLLTFELPDGATDETSDSTLQVAMGAEAGTNLEERTFRVDITEGERVVSGEENNEGKVVLGGIEFIKTTEGSSGMGQSDQTIRYSFMQNGKWFTFALQLHYGNPQAYDPPVETFDLAKQVEQMESILKTIKLAMVPLLTPNS